MISVWDRLLSLTQAWEFPDIAGIPMFVLGWGGKERRQGTVLCLLSMKGDKGPSPVSFRPPSPSPYTFLNIGL